MLLGKLLLTYLVMEPTLHMVGGRLIFTDGAGTDLDYIVNANTPTEYSGGAYFQNVTMQNCNPRIWLF